MQTNLSHPLIIENIPLKKFNCYRVGGNARYFAAPKSNQEKNVRMLIFINNADMLKELF